MYQVAKEIKEARLKAKLTQDELADLLDMKREAISRIESGKHSINITTLRLIADALGYKLPSKLLIKKR
jgi:transcriptional regulator with XRE-family HTH domain